MGRLKGGKNKENVVKKVKGKVVEEKVVEEAVEEVKEEVVEVPIKVNNQLFIGKQVEVNGKQYVEVVDENGVTFLYHEVSPGVYTL